MPSANAGKVNVFTSTSPRRAHPGSDPRARWISRSESRCGMRLIRRKMKLKSSTVLALSLLMAPMHAVAAQAGQDSAAASAPRREHYWRDFAAGFATSLLAHEAAHVVTAYAVGAHPY